MTALAAVLLATFAPQQDSPEMTSGGDFANPVEAGGAEAEPRAPLRLDHFLTYEEITQALADLASAAPDFARLDSIGRSQAGREIFVLTLSDLKSGAPSEKPSVFFAGFRAAPSTWGAEAVLAVARGLLEGEPETIRARLAGRSVYLAPALDPDVRATDAGEPAILFDQNFPVGWQPHTIRPGSGAYPFAIPESLAAARFLAEGRSIALIVGVTPMQQERRGLWKGSELPEADRSVLESLVRPPADGGEALLVPWSELGSRGGGFLDYAFQALGIFPCAFREAQDLQEPRALEAWVAAVASGAQDLLDALPRLRIEAEGLQQLAPGLWQLDVTIRNAGRLPTLSQLGGMRKVPGTLRISMSGAKLVATAHRPSGGGPFQAARLSPTDDLVLGQEVLGGGETRWVRLIVEGAPGSSLELVGSSVRAGRASLSVSLQ